MSFPLPVLNDLIRINLVSSHTPSQQIGENSLDYRVSGIIGAGVDLQTICNEFLTAMQSVFPAANCTSVVLSGVQAFLFDPVTGRVRFSAQALDNVTVGAAGADLVPSQVAPVLRKITGYPGRKNRGRAYFPFLADTFTTANGELSAAGIAALTTYYGIFFPTVTAGAGPNFTTVQSCLIHRVPLPLTSTDVLSVAITGKLGTQRRRGDYGRTNPPL